MIQNFENLEVKKLQQKFLKNGYLICNFKNKNKIIKIQKILTKKIKKKLKIKSSNPNLLNNLHKDIKVNKLNDLRLALINEINKDIFFKETLYKEAKEILDLIVGNELAIQKKVNLSIQLPNDNSSLLEIHSDTFSGESPYQVVLWVPLVDVFDTKSMFVFPLNESLKTVKNLGKLYSLKKYFEKNKKKANFLKIKFGQFLIFTPNLLHGNTINKTNETRFSLNIRLKSLFSPYNKIKGNDRKLGYFYLPLNIKPMTIIGSKYELPKF